MTKFVKQRDTQENNVGNNYALPTITQNTSGTHKFLEQKDNQENNMGRGYVTPTISQNKSGMTKLVK